MTFVIVLLEKKKEEYIVYLYSIYTKYRNLKVTPYIVVMTMRDSYLVPKSKKGIEDINNTSIRIVK